MAGDEPIRIRGLAELRRSLKAVEDGSPKMVRVALNEAAEIVVEHTLPWIPRRTGRLQRSLKKRSTQTSARVALGGSRAPYAPWMDFGGKRVGRGGGVAERRFIGSGRFAWRTLGIRRDKIAEALDKSLTGLVERSGLAVTDRG